MKPLKVVLLINDNVILPVYRLIRGLIEFVKPKKYMWITWLIMWLLNLNLVSIIVAFLPFCFSFSAKRKQYFLIFVFFAGGYAAPYVSFG